MAPSPQHAEIQQEGGNHATVHPWFFPTYRESCARHHSQYQFVARRIRFIIAIASAILWCVNREKRIRHLLHVLTSLVAMNVLKRSSKRPAFHVLPKSKANG
jgi:hypothetical protein